MKEQKYYSTKELTEMLRISRYTIFRATKNGDLPIAKKDGVQNLYSEEDVKRYMEQSGATKIETK